MKKKFAVVMAVTTMIMLVAFIASARAQDDELTRIRQAIAEKDAQWEAGETSVSMLPPEERRRLCGGLRDPSAEEKNPGREPYGDGGLPTEFDWRNKDGFDWTTSIKHQGCSDCWAFATVAALEVLVRIRASDPSLSVDLSEQHVVSCGHGSCTGWYLSNTCDYLRDSGTPDEACFQYTTPPMPQCANTCPDWEARATKITSWGWVSGDPDQKTPAEIKTEVQRAPVPTYMRVYTDFFSYVSGIYEYVTGDYEGGHFVVIVGWNDTGEYWICKNSWGTGWGEEGWFRIKMGVNECAMEENSAYMRLAAPVGGIWVPVDKFGLLAPYIGLVSTMLVATAATAIYVKRVKRKKKKQ